VLVKAAGQGIGKACAIVFARAGAEVFATDIDDEAQVYQQFLDRQPMGRIGSADEIARLALYLGSDESAYTIGGVHVIVGGMSI